MPEICRFLGIVIAMYYKEHEPPHFHAKYGEYHAAFAIENFGINRRIFAEKSGFINSRMGIRTPKRITRQLGTY